MIFRTADAGGVARVVDWAAAEGWNPGPDDAAAFHATDPAGFFLAVDGEEPVAGISVVNHSELFAFLGLYLCRPAWRGRGIAFALWQHALAHAGRRTVGLDGVPAQQANYAKSGFERTGETRRWTGGIAGRASADLRPVRAGDLSALAALDAAATGVDKGRFLALWLTDTGTRRTLVLDRGSPQGFVTARTCRAGIKIGPLVARDDADAVTLLHGAAALFPGEPAMVDVPDAVEGLTRHCEGLGLTVPFVTARMYRGPAPVPGPFVTAVATLELG
jgi:GNAT superfamily N-acetyltransferase